MATLHNLIDKEAMYKEPSLYKNPLVVHIIKDIPKGNWNVRNLLKNPNPAILPYVEMKINMVKGRLHSTFSSRSNMYPLIKKYPEKICYTSIMSNPYAVDIISEYISKNELNLEQFARLTKNPNAGELIEKEVQKRVEREIKIRNNLAKYEEIELSSEALLTIKKDRLEKIKEQLEDECDNELWLEVESYIKSYYPESKYWFFMFANPACETILQKYRSTQDLPITIFSNPVLKNHIPEDMETLLYDDNDLTCVYMCMFKNPKIVELIKSIQERGKLDVFHRCIELANRKKIPIFPGAYKAIGGIPEDVLKNKADYRYIAHLPEIFVT